MTEQKASPPQAPQGVAYVAPDDSPIRPPIGHHDWRWYDKDRFCRRCGALCLNNEDEPCDWRLGDPKPDFPDDDDIRLAAALTPRELTDEEAERGARAIDPGAGWSFKYAPGEERLRAAYEERQKRALTTARAAYRAIIGGGTK